MLSIAVEDFSIYALVHNLKELCTQAQYQEIQDKYIATHLANQ